MGTYHPLTEYQRYQMYKIGCEKPLPLGDGWIA